MTVSELIEKLSSLPKDAQVLHIWDGEPRTSIEHVWVTKDGKQVMTADCNQVLYSEENRPESVSNRYWRTPSKSQGTEC